MARTLTDWQNIVRRMIALEVSSGLSEEAKLIDGEGLRAAMTIVNNKVEDVTMRRIIGTTFSIRTRFEALNEIIDKHLAGDPELALEVAEAAGGAVVDRGNYLT